MKAITKTAVFYICRILVIPLFVTFIALSAFISKDRAFVGLFQLLSLLPGMPGTYIRASFFSFVNPDISQDISIGFLTLFSHLDTEIGKNVYIGPQSNIGKCKIGSDCLLGSGVHILSGKKQHSFSDKSALIKDQPGSYSKVSIGQNTWIGNNATVMANIGNNCVIAAGSVVTKDVEENMLVAGNPARFVRQVFSD